MTRSLSDELPKDETQEVDPYIKDYKYRSIPRYIKDLFKSQNADVLIVSEVDL